MTGRPSPRPVWVAGNWKLHCPLPEATRLADQIAGGWQPGWRVRGLVAPVFTALEAVGRVLRGHPRASPIALAGQNLYPTEKGAFTGEVSGPHLTAVGCSHVLVGHSERRTLFGETGQDVRARLRAASVHGLVPVLCVGETLEQRRAGRTHEVVAGQCDEALEGAPLPSPAALLVAYEPVWAIGTGEVATAAGAQEVHQRLRAHLTERLGHGAGLWPILYGGSVKPQSAGDLVAQPDIDGLLVGGASLTAESFLAIAAAADQALA